MANFEPHEVQVEGRALSQPCVHWMFHLIGMWLVLRYVFFGYFFLKCAITKVKIFTSLQMKFQCQLFLSSNGIFLCAAGELFSLGIRYKTVFNTENNKLIITAIYVLVKKFPCVQRRCLSHSSHTSCVPGFTVVANQSDPICS